MTLFLLGTLELDEVALGISAIAVVVSLLLWLAARRNAAAAERSAGAAETSAETARISAGAAERTARAAEESHIPFFRCSASAEKIRANQYYIYVALNNTGHVTIRQVRIRLPELTVGGRDFSTNEPQTQDFFGQVGHPNKASFLLPLSDAQVEEIAEECARKQPQENDPRNQYNVPVKGVVYITAISGTRRESSEERAVIQNSSFPCRIS